MAMVCHPSLAENFHFWECFANHLAITTLFTPFFEPFFAIISLKKARKSQEFKLFNRTKSAI